MNKRKSNPLQRFWKYYIKGEYHCNNCPYSWEERWYDDCDAGCYIKGDIADDACRLLPPFRAIIGWYKKKTFKYYSEHEYDGYAEFYQKTEKQKEVLSNSIKEHILSKCWLGYEDWDTGKFKKIDENHIESLLSDVWRVYYDYEEFAHSSNQKKLSTEWKELFEKTWNKLIWYKIKPFVPNKKKVKQNDLEW